MKKTIAKEISFFGKALQTGVETHVTCKPANKNAGIVFKRTDLENSPELCLSNSLFSSGDRRSTVSLGAASIQTIEHFLAALWALEIDNIMVEIDGAELPGLDGSAIEFIKLLKTAGIQEQDAVREVIKITEKEEIKDGDVSLSIFPDDTVSVSYYIDYGIKSIKEETFKIELTGKLFESEIAGARTFCLKEEAEALLKAGLGQGANFENTLVMDENGPVQTKLRFENEPVRHKILDLVGDFYMLGKPIIGRIVARKSGHKTNAAMLNKIYQKYVCKDN
ncbi:MAG: UDP-3-O-acyl-N-acetylglucosamine deacetylase [Candidatus Omnitrophota bacterium]